MYKKTTSLAIVAAAVAVALAPLFAAIDVTAYQITPSPTAVMVTFANGPESRGFSWQTDTTVAESEVRLVAGAATPEDFAWWSGLGLTDCRRGIAALGGELVAERWKGREFFVHRDARTRGFRSGSVLLLPPFDEYLIGYKSRDVVLHPDRSHHAHNQSGIFYPIIALDGEIVGNWSPSAPDGALKLFKDVSLPEEGVQKQLETYSTVTMMRR